MSTIENPAASLAPLGPGVGVDMVEVRRLGRLAEAPTAVSAILTERERAYCFSRARPAEHLAARFAGKRAVLMALGMGEGDSRGWIDVEILPGRGGRPVVNLGGRVAARAQACGLSGVDVSLWQTPALAITLAVVTWAGALEAERLGIGDIGLFVYHQANARIARAVAERLGLPPSRRLHRRAGQQGRRGGAVSDHRPQPPIHQRRK